MKNKIFLALICGVFCKPQLLHAQSFTVEQSAMQMTYTEPVSGINHIYSLGHGNLTLRWRVISCDFPADWLIGTAYCDNNVCRYGTVLCPSYEYLECAFPAESEPVGIGWTFNLDDATSYGTYSMTLELTDANDQYSVATESYTVSRPEPKALVNNASSLFIYPNPAMNQITVQSNICTGVQAITIFNAAGTKVIETKAVNGTNNVDISKLPAGIYSVQLRSAAGEILAKENFMHQ